MSQTAARILDFSQDFIPENELVWSDGEPLDSSYERKHINLSLDVVDQRMAALGEDDYYAGGDEFVYYSNEQARAVARAVQLPLPLPWASGMKPPADQPLAKKLFRGPDVFVVRGGVRQRERRGWVSWLEDGRLPDFVFEIQSPSTAAVDAGEKRQLYAELWKSREYFCYGPDDAELGRGYRDVLVGLRLGRRGGYEVLRPDERGWIWSEVLEAYVGRWDGVYQKTEDRWVRLYDGQGRLIPTAEEAERRQKEEERRQKEEERRQKEEERRQKEEERRQKEEEWRHRKMAEQRAEAERRKREAAEQRAAAAEAELLRLKKLMGSDDF